MVLVRFDNKVATRGGEESTEGWTLPDAIRCDKVTEPSEFDHIITIGELAIWDPKPLHTLTSAHMKSSSTIDAYIAIQPRVLVPVLWRTYWTVPPFTTAEIHIS